jgi:hypothetical protein
MEGWDIQIQVLIYKAGGFEQRGEGISGVCKIDLLLQACLTAGDV